MTTGAATAINGSPLTGQQWCSWLGEPERISFDEYQKRPNRLVSDFNGEKTFVNDYLGREILELFQNANDAAAKAGQRSHFELLPGGLMAADTGAPFFKVGIRKQSLADSSAPSHQTRAPRFITTNPLAMRSHSFEALILDASHYQ